jgi:hypothetical protein
MSTNSYLWTHTMCDGPISLLFQPFSDPLELRATPDGSTPSGLVNNDLVHGSEVNDEGSAGSAERVRSEGMAAAARLDVNTVLCGKLDNGGHFSSSSSVNKSQWFRVAAKVPRNGVYGIIKLAFDFN